MKNLTTILGRSGFIGSQIALRYSETNSFPTEKTEVLYNFGSPVHPPFEENPDYHMSEIFSSAMYLHPYCRDNNIFYVYPSSALVYEKDTAFAKTKKITEILASCYPNTLGLRIYPVYGPGEDRTVISQWCRMMKNDERPVIYGDGTQERDFIYIDDAVNQIISLVDNKVTGVKDVGAGKPVSFNQIVKTINLILGKNIEPIYISAPKDYSKGIVCQNPGLCETSLADGIRKVLNE